MPAVERVEQFSEGCSLGRQHRAAFPHAATSRAEKRLELTHGNLCSPTPTTPTGNWYFLLIVYDANQYMWVEMLRSKAEVLKYFKEVKALAKNELGLK